MGNRKDDHENEPAPHGAEDSRHAPPPSQKGPQAHAEGQHGDKTHQRFMEQLHEGERRESRESRIERDRHDLANQGGRRLVEDREQHDEAEKNSEHNKLFAEAERGRDVGPSDNRGNLHGVLEHREQRSDYKERNARGLREEDESQ